MKKAARAARELVGGTRFDPLARRVWKALHQSPSAMERQSEYIDRLTLEVMDRVLLRDSNCVDVGSFFGNLLWAMFARAPHGTHYAFEPLPHLAAKLRRRFPVRRFPSVHIIEAAVADFSGSATFHFVKTHPGYSGLRRRRYDYPNERIRLIEVPVVRLDDVIPPGVLISLIKIDVEGAELGVLRGGVRTISTCRPHIVFEHGDAAEGYGTRPRDLYDLLSGALGLNVSTPDAWLKSNRPFTRAQFSRRVESGAAHFFLAYP